MGSVAEGLGFALAAGAPVVGFACANSDGCGGILGDFRFIHGLIAEEF